MKKTILTIGLFSLVMILTSFTSSEPTNTIQNSTTVSAAGAGAAGGTVKMDAAGAGAAGGTVKMD